MEYLPRASELTIQSPIDNLVRHIQGLLYLLPIKGYIIVPLEILTPTECKQIVASLQEKGYFVTKFITHYKNVNFGNMIAGAAGCISTISDVYRVPQYEPVYIWALALTKESLPVDAIKPIEY